MSRFVKFSWHFCDITLGPCASRSELAEACGLCISWPMVRAIYIPKFTSLSRMVSEISANVTFLCQVCDWRTHRRTYTLTARNIYIDRYHIKSYMRIFCNLHIQYVTLHTHLCILRKKIFSNSSCLKRTGIFCNIRYYRLAQMPSFLNARNLKCLLVRNITGIWFFRNSVLANFLCWNRRSNGHWLYSVHWLFDYISNDRL